MDSGAGIGAGAGAGASASASASAGANAGASAVPRTRPNVPDAGRWMVHLTQRAQPGPEAPV
jgi:hypothetical protein